MRRTALEVQQAFPSSRSATPLSAEAARAETGQSFSQSGSERRSLHHGGSSESFRDFNEISEPLRALQKRTLQEEPANPLRSSVCPKSLCVSLES